MMFSFLLVNQNLVEVYWNSALLGVLEYSLPYKNQIFFPDSIELSSDSITCHFSEGSIEDNFSYRGGQVCIERSWKFKKPGQCFALFSFRPHIDEVHEWLIPSVVYRNNRDGQGHFPRAKWQDGYSFREDRMPIPNCSLVRSNKGWCSIASSAACKESEVSSLKTTKIENSLFWQVRVPYQESPWSYREKGMVFGASKKEKKDYFLVGDKPFIFKKTFYLFKLEESSFEMAYQKVFEFYWKHESLKFESIKKPNWQRYIQLKFHHLKQLIVDKKNISGVKAGKWNFWYQPLMEYTAGSFLVRGIEAACVVHKIGVVNQKAELCDLAERMGRFQLSGALKNGLHQDFYHFILKKRGAYIIPLTPNQYKYGVNTRGNAETMLSLLDLYKRLRVQDQNCYEFLDLVKNNAHFYVKNQLESGSYGRWWSKEGNCLDERGTNGAHMMVLLCELESMFGLCREREKSLLKAFSFYSSLVDQMEYYGDTLDADCIDKEAGVALLRGFMALYQWKSDERFLAYAKKSASFILSWVWTYNVTWPESSKAYQYQVKTKGLTSVSVDHHHLDFYGPLIAYDFFKLAKISGESLWSELAQHLLSSCYQLIAGPENKYLGKNKKFLGWQPEQLNQTTWDYRHHLIGGKGDFHNCIAWPVVLGLYHVLKIQEDFSDLVPQDAFNLSSIY